MMKKKEAENSCKKLPRGVSYDKGHRGTKKYKTRVFWNGKDRFVGRWVCVETEEAEVDDHCIRPASPCAGGAGLTPRYCRSCRFATIEQAEAAYQQAYAAFRRSHPNESDESELLGRVRALVHVLEDTETETDATGCVPDASETIPWPSQQQQAGGAGLSSMHSSSSSRPQHDVGAAAAAAADDPASCPATAAAAAAPLPGMQLESYCITAAQLQQPCYELDEGVMDMADLLLEELLAGDVPVGLMRMSSSCTNLAAAAAAAHMQQPQQQQQLCQDRAVHSCPLTPLQGCFAPAAAAAAPGPGPAPAPFSFNAAQQQNPEAELQVLLDKILQGAGQLDAPNAPTAAELHERALQQCCDEFLLSTASPALSAPPAGGYPAAAQQQQQRPSYSTLSGPAGASAPGRASLELTSRHAAVLRPAGLARQGSLLLHADRCHDAVLYVSAVAQAVLELSSALLSRYGHTQGQSVAGL